MEKLIHARRKRMWTQQEAAEKIGVSEKTLARWERGETTPYGFNIERICRAYEIPPEELGLSASPPIAVQQYSPVDDPSPIPFQQQDLTLRLLRIAWQHGIAAGYHDLQMQVIQELSTMDKEDLTRRDALKRLALLPIEMGGISLVQFALKASETEVLAQCATGLAACWQLRKGRELSFVSQVLERYVPALKRIAHLPAHHTMATDLLAQCYLLKGPLACHTEGYDAAVRYAKKAEQYARDAGNVTMYALALRTQAAVHYYGNQWQEALRVAQQAAYALETAKGGPLPAKARSYIYAGLATYQAAAAQKQDALRSLEKAREAFVAETRGEPAPVWVDHSQENLVLNDGKTHFHLGMHTQALDAYQQIESRHNLKETLRVEALISEAMSEVLRGDVERDMEYIIDRWTAGIAGAKALHSRQRFTEALSVYVAMRGAWPAEPRIKALRELLR